MGQERTSRLDRLLAFSDGVFAIALTLLALDLKAPIVDRASADIALPRELLAHVPSDLGFVISFVVVAVYWRKHHQLFDGVRDCDPRIVLINFSVLFGVVVLPFPTSLIGYYGAGSRVPAVLYAATVTFVALATFALGWAIRAGPLSVPEDTASSPRAVLLDDLTPPLVFLASIPVAAVRPALAIALWCAVPVFQGLVLRADRVLRR